MGRYTWRLAGVASLVGSFHSTLVVDKLIPNVLNFGYLYSIAAEPIYVGKILVSALVILFFCVLNLRGIKSSGRAQLWIVAALIAGVLAVFGGMLAAADFGAFRENYIEGYSFRPSQILLVMAVTPYLFIGFDAVPQLVKDMDVSRRAASAMAIASLLIGMICYILLNFSTGLAYGPNEAIALDWALGSAVLEHLGPALFIVLVVALASAVITTHNAFMICASKLICAMARQNALPSILGSTTERGVPRNSIIAVSAIGIVACFLGREVVLWTVDMCSFGAAVAYFYVCYNTFRIAEKKGVKAQARDKGSMNFIPETAFYPPHSKSLPPSAKAENREGDCVACIRYRQGMTRRWQAPALPACFCCRAEEKPQASVSTAFRSNH